MVKFSAPGERVIRTGNHVGKKCNNKGDIKNADSYSPNELALIKLIISDGTMTTIEMANALNISRKSVSAIIKKLKEANIVYRLGSKKKGQWKINNDNI